MEWRCDVLAAARACDVLEEACCSWLCGTIVSFKAVWLFHKQWYGCVSHCWQRDCCIYVGRLYHCRWGDVISSGIAASLPAVLRYCS